MSSHGGAVADALPYLGSMVPVVMLRLTRFAAPTHRPRPGVVDDGASPTYGQNKCLFVSVRSRDDHGQTASPRDGPAVPAAALGTRRRGLPRRGALPTGARLPTPTGTSHEKWARANEHDWKQVLDVLVEDTDVINGFTKTVRCFQQLMFNTAESRLTAFHAEVARSLGE